MLFKKQTWHWPHIVALISCGIVAALIPILLDVIWDKDLL